MSYMIGVDVGGTFTDLSVFNTQTEQIFNYKLSSTPQDPSQAIVTGIETLLGLLGMQAEQISYLAHGTFHRLQSSSDTPQAHRCYRLFRTR